MEINEKDVQDMDMDESDSQMDYYEAINHTQKRIEYELPLATHGKKDKNNPNLAKLDDGLDESPTVMV